MRDVYIYNTSRTPKLVADDYKSLIWAKRYHALGDCELYVPATEKYVQGISVGEYIVRPDDDMVCVITKLEIDTDPENGNYIIATGTDVRSLLDRRIIWGTYSCKGSVEEFLRSLIDSELISATDSRRRMSAVPWGSLVTLGALANLPGEEQTQISYANLGEYIREKCRQYGWGYKAELNTGAFAVSFYKGTDRSSTVRFTPAFDNIAGTKYTDNRQNMGNAFLVGGVGEGAERWRTDYGVSSGINRYEHFVDARDVQREITFDELQAAFPGGTINPLGNYYVYNLDPWRILIIDSTYLAWLQSIYPSGTVDGDYFDTGDDYNAARLMTASPAGDDTVTLGQRAYEIYLATRAANKMHEFGAVTSFEGEILPDVTYTYKTDYNLGDIVRIENEYGIGADARLVEMIESFDDTGYKLSPSFEYWAE